MPRNSLLDWSAQQPAWQQDALRRLSMTPTLSTEDTKGVMARLKAVHGLKPKGDLSCEVLAAQHLKPTGQSVPRAQLCSIGPVSNVGRLAPEQQLPFAVDGVTVIYGENGSGKSGYCRIAKKLCRARVVDDLIGNVFVEGQKPPATARVRYKLDGDNHIRNHDWQDGNPGPPEIAHISVFDSANGRLYVDDTNTVEYLPYEIELLTRFAQLLSTLRRALESELSEVAESPLATGYTPGTAVSRMLERLAPTSQRLNLPTREEIEQLGTWNQKLAGEFDDLRTRLTADPGTLAQRARRLEGILDDLIRNLDILDEALSVTHVAEFERKVRHARETAQAAKLSARNQFANEPLDSVGCEPWKLMFQYAKEYSRLVYPNVDPPATGSDRLCVLCQQPLSRTATDRLQRFEAYVSNRTVIDAEQAALDLDAAIRALRGLNIRSTDDVENLLAEYRSVSSVADEVATQTVDAFRTARARRDVLVAMAASQTPREIPDLRPGTSRRLKGAAESLALEAKTHEEAAGKGDDKEPLRHRHAELADIQRLSLELQVVLARRASTEKTAMLRACLNATNTQSTSIQVNVLRKQLVTTELRKRIRTEIRTLDLTHIPFEIHEESRYGESKVGVLLDAKVPVANRDVLSEGEQRALALACFLADAGGQPAKHGLIFDDPVSSLDDQRLQRVAYRLVQEAGQGRQIVVFTHNLAFVSRMRDAAGDRSVPFAMHYIYKSQSEGFGLVSPNSEPWQSKRLTDRIQVLRCKLKEFEAGADIDPETHGKQVADFYTKLRESWERLVEELLLGKVVERYGTDVKTQSIRHVAVEDSDHQEIFWAMKCVSEYSGHDTAVAQPVSLPSHEDMRRDLDRLDQYRSKLRARAKETIRRREKLEAPPEAQIM